MTTASRSVARSIAVRASMRARGVEPTPRPTEPVEVCIDLSSANVVRSTTRDGVPYARFSAAGRTVMAFGEIAEAAATAGRADGWAVETATGLKVVAIRAFEHRSTLIDELGDEWTPAVAA